MLNEKLRAEIDQATTGLIEVIPPVWRGLFQGCIAEGFTAEQAMELVKAYILANGTGGVKGT